MPAANMNKYTQISFNIPKKSEFSMPIVLPQGKRCAVCVSIDTDCWSIMLRMRAVGLVGEGTYGPINFTRGEFGATVGIPRIMEVLDKYNVSATWFTPGVIADTYPHVIKEIAARGHEIGHHGYFQECPGWMNEKEERESFERGITAIENATGQRPLVYKVPGELRNLNALPTRAVPI